MAPIRLVKLNNVELQFCTQPGGRLPAVTHLKAAVRLLALLGRSEQVKTQQVPKRLLWVKETLQPTKQAPSAASKKLGCVSK